MAHGMVHDLSRFSAEEAGQKGQMSSLLPDSGALRLWVYPSLAGVIYIPYPKQTHAVSNIIFGHIP